MAALEAEGFLLGLEGGDVNNLCCFELGREKTVTVVDKLS